MFLTTVLGTKEYCMTFYLIWFNYFRFYILKYDLEYPIRNPDFKKNNYNLRQLSDHNEEINTSYGNPLILLDVSL